jgi:RHS repeat-associated protein
MPVAMTKGASRYYLIYDQVGSLRLVADNVGNIVKDLDYDSFGNVIRETNPSFEIPFGFAGGLFDKDTGLIRFGRRDYDPDSGRWTAKDPILFAGGDINLYGYCLNDPVNLVDPEGQFGVLGTIAGGISGAYGGFLSGMSSGDVTTGIMGGIAGGLVGGALGTFNPAISGAAGGAVGGFLTGSINEYKDNPCSSSRNIATAGALSSLKGGIIGGLTGMIGGGISSGVRYLGASQIAGQTTGAMVSTPIAWGLGLI